MTENNTNRWIIAVAGVFMQIALGAVYGWSVFRIPLTKAYGWTVPEVTVPFELAIFMLGITAFAGGVWMRRSGPRRVALLAASLYGLGMLSAGWARSLPALYFTFGVIGGTGLGFGYIVPVATLIRWFPDKRGMAMGIAVGGFGAGALITAPITERLITAVGVSDTFAALGIVYLVIVGLAAWVMKNPPEGYLPGRPQHTAQDQPKNDFTLREALHSWQFYGMWLVLFLNTVAGIAVISQASPMAQEVSGVDAGQAARLVGIISIANGCGRFLWAWFSDVVGRKSVFVTMFLLQAGAFLLLSRVTGFVPFALLSFVILLCYGGGFGTMPAFAADYFGSNHIGAIYGIILTAWGAAGIAGPTLIAQVRQASGEYQGALRAMALVALLSALAPLILRPPVRRRQVPSGGDDRVRPGHRLAS